MNFCIVTTVNKPTKAIEELYKKFGDKLIIVGDKKTPQDWEYKGIKPIFDTKIYAPDNHYAKKNLGYLEAIRNKAELIYDTDDDNIPNENWKVRTEQVDAIQSFLDGWFNIYKLFTKERFIWPRGFPLRQLKRGIGCEVGGIKASSIQQGLSDGEPDVDAIWRLVFDKGIKFENLESIYLDRNKWCPFNSQSTWWFPKAFPLLYLPVYCNFRMTDIWRSFVAQRCLWELGEGVTFHSPAEVYQDRNEHDLMQDFESEIPGYLYNEKIAQLLSTLILLKGEENICNNMMECYSTLITNNILPGEEMYSLQQWIKRYDAARNMG